MPPHTRLSSPRAEKKKKKKSGSRWVGIFFSHFFILRMGGWKVGVGQPGPKCRWRKSSAEEAEWRRRFFILFHPASPRENRPLAPPTGREPEGQLSSPCPPPPHLSPLKPDFLFFFGRRAEGEWTTRRPRADYIRLLFKLLFHLTHWIIAFFKLLFICLLVLSLWNSFGPSINKTKISYTHLFFIQFHTVRKEMSL